MSSVVTYTKADLLNWADKLGMDLRDAQAKLDELRKMIAASSLPEEQGELPECPHCGPLRAVRNESQLAEHLENVHGEEPHVA